MSTRTVVIYFGEDAVITVKAFDPALGTVDDLEARIDLTGATAHMVWRDNATDAAAEITKVSPAGGIVIRADQTALSADRGVYDIAIDAVDITGSGGLPLGLKTADTWIVTAASKKKHVEKFNVSLQSSQIT
jgi:hypothetical protein